ncbi:MAG: hypothetical protein NUV97_01065 [archaeon]|nr:hypothetical protein [archaeon]MCR4323448.1 hypothetical protein [Nanoarchaeota archaeon]
MKLKEELERRNVPPSNPEKRYLFRQLECVAVHKEKLEEERGREMSDDEAITHWVENGFARKFCETYPHIERDGEELTCRALYDTLVSEKDEQR